ncbi:hypothetical protein CHS0354_009529 [Potamilus streckersoni]|uniref:RING-type domain-containing protein n=1 Tax=Potamilus streckersoni TaxID=2493646 RepID=A0AAE0VYP7_9BIVA|nr:hypothetical protein CHS0354_009529 [Potamilus streckersoni]
MAEAQDSSSKQLCCPICLETFKSPKSLPCMHTFCEKCICKHATDLGKEGKLPATISCPVCSKVILTPTTNENPEEWAAKLPNNLIVLSPSPSNQADVNAPVYCEACASVDQWHVSVAFCVTCSEYLCQSCLSHHNRLKTSRDHQIRVHADLEHQIPNSLKDSMYKCQTHNKRLTYFCSDHRECICTKCALHDHRKCKDIVSVEDRLDDRTVTQDNFNHALQNLDILRKMFLLLTKNRESTIQTIQQQKLHVIKSIKDWSSFRKARVEEVKTITMRELEQLCQNETIIISKQVNECKRSIAAIEASQTMLLESETSDDKCKTFVTMTKVSQQLQKYLQQYDMVESRSNDMTIEFRGNQNQQNQCSCGVSSKLSRIPMLSNAFRFEGTFMLPSPLKLNSVVTFNVETISDKKACNIISGACLPDRKIVLYDDGNCKIKLFDKRFRLLSHLDLYINSNICVFDRNTVAIASGSRIHLVSVTNSLQTVKSIDCDDACYGLVSYEQNLIVYTSANKIIRYNASYKCTIITQLPESVTHRQIPMSTAGQMIYCAVKNKIITIDMNYKALKTFVVNDLKDVTIAVDKNGIIYCCGRETSNVVLFSPEGRQLGTLLSHEHGIENPTCIFLNSRNNKLFVFQSMSYKQAVDFPVEYNFKNFNSKHV